MIKCKDCRLFEARRYSDKDGWCNIVFPSWMADFVRELPSPLVSPEDGCSFGKPKDLDLEERDEPR